MLLPQRIKKLQIFIHVVCLILSIVYSRKSIITDYEDIQRPNHANATSWSQQEVNQIFQRQLLSRHNFITLN